MNLPVAVHASEVVDQTDSAFPVPVSRVEIGCGYGSILYTSGNLGHRPASRFAKERMKSLLAIRLAQTLARGREISIPETDTITIRTTALGCPELLFGTNEGPSVSFAWSDGTAWAALGSGDYSVGMDVAGAAEFGASYPIHRAFDRSELGIAMQETQGNLPEAAALLWSLKEGAVKALGCGFHLVDPLQVTVMSGRRGTLDDSFSIVLADRAIKKLRLEGSPFLKATVIRKHGFWLAVALFDPA